MLQISFKLYHETCVQKLSLLDINPKVLILDPYIINKDLNGQHFKSLKSLSTLLVMGLHTFYGP